MLPEISPAELMNTDAWFLAHALPGATIEDANGWDDRMTAGLPVVFERIVVVDRCKSSANKAERWLISRVCTLSRWRGRQVGQDECGCLTSQDSSELLVRYTRECHAVSGR